MSIRLNSMKNIPYSQSSVRLPSSCHLGHLGHLSRHFMKSQSHLSFVFYIADWQTDWQTNNIRIYRSALQTIRNNEHFFWYSLFSFDTKIYHINFVLPDSPPSLPVPHLFPFHHRFSPTSLCHPYHFSVSISPPLYTFSYLFSTPPSMPP